MLIETQIKMKWNNANKKYYTDKGYVFTKNGDIFYVNIKDLSYGSSVKLKIKCDDCGREYLMTCGGYFKGYENSLKKNIPLVHFCDECKFIHNRNSLYDRALQTCEKRRYVLLSDQTEILCNTSYIRYLCPLHGEHKMRINNLISGKGCPDCVALNNSKKFRLSSDEVEQRIAACGGKLLNKNDYINRYEKNLLIECFECGKPFITSFVLFTQHGGQVCEQCKKVKSIGEHKIKCYLENHNINFIQQKWFSDCRDTNPLPFDFYLPLHNIIIEFDGRQHFEETEYFTYPLDVVQRHDKIKNEYCANNNIYLIRIPYWDINKISEILDTELILS